MSIKFRDSHYRIEWLADHLIEINPECAFCHSNKLGIEHEKGTFFFTHELRGLNASSDPIIEIPMSYNIICRDCSYIMTFRAHSFLNWIGEKLKLAEELRKKIGREKVTELKDPKQEPDLIAHLLYMYDGMFTKRSINNSILKSIKALERALDLQNDVTQNEK